MAFAAHPALVELPVRAEPVLVLRVCLLAMAFASTFKPTHPTVELVEPLASRVNFAQVEPVDWYVLPVKPLVTELV